MTINAINLQARAAALEARFLKHDPKTQAAIIQTATVLFQQIGPGGGCPQEDLLAILDLIQNAGGKVQRGVKSEAQVLAELQAGAPTLSARFLEAIAG